MKETLSAIAATLFFLVSIGQLDPNMTIGELIGMYYPQEETATLESESEEIAQEAVSSESGAEVADNGTTELPVIVIEDSVEPTVTLYTEADAKAMAAVMHAEANGLNDAQKKAVGWCVLNRVDDWGGTVQSVAKSEAFVRSSSYTEEEVSLANEVLYSWSIDGPRELPEGYYYFNGDGEQNYFKRELSGERLSIK